MADDNIRFRDFSSSPEPIVMRIAPDVFHLYPEIPLDVMIDIAEASAVKGEEKSGVRGQMESLTQLLQGVIVPEHYDAFIERTKRGTAEKPNPNPIGMRQVQQILPWVLEVYGLRPTQQSSDSADGSDETSTQSTELASDEESTSSNFLSLES